MTAGDCPRIVTTHPGYPAPFVRELVRWVARRLGMPAAALRTLTVEVRYCRDHRGRGRWTGRYRHKIRTVTVALPSGPVAWPQSMAHNREEREAGREAADELELVVALLAHELEHARATIAARDIDELRTGNHEPTVRAMAWGVVREFREARGGLITDRSGPRGGVTSRPAT